MQGAIQLTAVVMLEVSSGRAAIFAEYLVALLALPLPLGTFHGLELDVPPQHFGGRCV
jgi:hypothetical protein